MPDLVLTDDHRYFLGEKELDGVTTVIKKAGLMPSYQPQDIEWYLERGQIIHEVTELYDKGILDETTVDPIIAGYLESWKQFRQSGYTPKGIESKLADEIYGYAGTIDRLPLLDIKSGVPERWHLAQLGGYYGLCKANKLPPEYYLGPESRKSVYLKENGSMPQVIQFGLRETSEALKTFLCALNCVRFKNGS